MSLAADPDVPINAKGLLLACEGRDDEAFLQRMLTHLKITGVLVRQYRGKPELPTFLLGLCDSSEFELVRALGILRDADGSASRAFQSVSDRLQRLDLPRPRHYGGLGQGTCGIDGIVRVVGVFIMPNGEAPGALEDLCLRAIQTDEGLRCAEEFLACVHARTGVVCPEQHQPKARLNAWLASREDPTLRIGQAIASGDIPPDSPAFAPIRAFLQQLAAAAGT